VSSPGFRYSLESPAPSWLYLVGDETVVGMLTPVDQSVVDAVWTVVSRPGASFDAIVSAVPERLADGRVLSFVALAVRPEADGTAAVSLLVHGVGTVDVEVVGGSVRVAPPADRSWARSELSGVVAVSSVTGDGAGIGASVEFPVAGGIIVADRIAWGAGRVVPDRDLDDTRLVRAADLTREIDRTVTRDELLSGRIHGAHASSGGAAETGDVEGGDVERGDVESGDVERRRVESADAPLPVTPEPSPAPSPTPDALRDEDGPTVVRASLPAPPLEERTTVRTSVEPPTRTPVQTFAFRVRDGQPYPLDVVHYVGRNPKQPRIPLKEPVRLFSVASPTKLVSSTHLELRQQGDSVVVTDLRSTNGTSVILPGRDWQRLRADQGIAVIPGTFIDIGDGVVLEILPPTGASEARRTAV
jgi:hypothetical protein